MNFISIFKVVALINLKKHLKVDTFRLAVITPCLIGWNTYASFTATCPCRLPLGEARFSSGH